MDRHHWLNCPTQLVQLSFSIIYHVSADLLHADS